MVETQKLALANMLKEGAKKKIKRSVMEAVCHVITTESCGNTNVEREHHTPAIKEAIEQQRQIGIHLMLRGYMAKK